MNLAARWGAALAALAAGAALAAPTSAPLNGQTVRIAFMDPLSGSFASVGQNFLRSWQLVAEHYSGLQNHAGVKFEIIPFDNKNSPQESLNALKAAAGQGLRYVTGGNSSSAAAAIMEAVARHNERNPGKEILYINYAAVDPTLTNEKCAFWHFRLDADTSMKMEALTTFMKDQPKVGSVYLFNQNYAHGQQVAKYFKDAIARKRPDVKIAGEELHPLGQVKDFAPYVAKIKQSGADTIVTGNWGQDLTLLVKAMNDAGLRLPLYTYYAQVTGTPTALAAGGDGEVYVVSYGHPNIEGEMGRLTDAFKRKFNEDYWAQSSYNGIQLLAGAIAKAKSIEPLEVAKAMEGLSIKSFAGEATMRAADHQLQQAMFISHWRRVDAKHRYDVENTGYTFVPVKRLEPYQSSTPTSCQMKRPSGAAQ